MKIVYICAPLSGDIGRKHDRTMEAVKRIMEEYRQGGKELPLLFVPHLAFLTLSFDFQGELDREWGVKMCLKMVELCDEMMVIGGELTMGMMKETERAWELGKIVTRRTDL